ncbi:tyrosine-type recombinase/integrase (plasmid) [Mesorhizobium sp. AR07]|uniref:tyrosine-type recombinase/integrase n=1 Tax=Mesorhizobium sp. AR07 TaxID=2865838 RepID=UPI00215E89B4|nr:tyrosine-type recombinase/integrase [Mesorhizobium sp. AR07]UVK48523.1 tyrosine-type recombinase/integrase [Mesorhizobium sp. AR07]
MSPRLPEPSSPIARHIVAFVRHKRALNRRYDVEDKVLRMLDGYLNVQGVTSMTEITPALLDAFFLSRPRSRPRSFNHLIGVVGRLFEWMVEHDVIDRSPVTMKPRRRGNPRPPCILDLRTAQQLIDRAAELPDQNNAPLRGRAYATIFSLLFGLGLRVGEVARLRWRDVDQGRNVLTIRETKFSKSRLIPIGPHLAQRLYAFMALRSQHLVAVTADTPLFSFLRGRPVNPGTISIIFRSLADQLDIAIPPGGTPAHVHDLRHSFAVGRLLRWYRDGSNANDKLVKLSTFMGHVDPASTAVYLTITADLLEAAGQRFERFAAPLSRGGRP